MKDFALPPKMNYWEDLKPHPGKNSKLYYIIDDDGDFVCVETLNEAIERAKIRPAKEIREFTYSKRYLIEINVKEDLPL